MTKKEIVVDLVQILIDNDLLNQNYDDAIDAAKICIGSYLDDFIILNGDFCE